ncbi:MAG: L-threonylcarbamoyladenylate synthase [Thermoleophilia bacterium]|nr:L-threonylcarbamoyladenylate synthase [Thermoleophilia bacterium]
MRAAKAGALRLGSEALDGPTVALLARALERGAVIGLPTDTVYGLAASWNSATGVRRLFAAKGRAEERPVAVLFPSAGAIFELLPDVGDAVARVLRALLPGPYTFVVSTSIARPPLVGTPDSLGVRVPAHPPLLELLARLGVPLAATSANLSGGSDPADLHEVDPRVLMHSAAALDLGARPAGRPSTVVDLRPLLQGRTPLVLREGTAPAAELLARIAAATG